MTSASLGDAPPTAELAALSTLSFERLDAVGILDHARAAVPRIGPCRTEGTYRLVDDQWQSCPQGGREHPDIGQLVAKCGGMGPLEVPERAWVRAFPLRCRDIVEGSLVVSAARQPSSWHIQLLMVLANQTGAALGCRAHHQREERFAEELDKATTDLAGAQQRLQSRTRVHETMEAAVADNDGEQAITDALHELTAMPVALEDRFGNLRSWSGPERPVPYPKANSQQRQRQLAVLGDQQPPTRMKNRITVLIRPHGEILGVLAIVDPDKQVTEDHLFALNVARTLLGYELAHQQSLVELKFAVHRELVADLIAGTATPASAFARAEALGHDLRRPNYVLVVHSWAGFDSVLVTAANRAAEVLHLNSLGGRRGQLVVLLTEGRPDPRALHRELSELLGGVRCAIGMGSRCDAPADFPTSFAAARRALTVRLHSAAPVGASAYDELGFYRLVDAARAGGAVEDFIREWLGALLDYDLAKKAQLVLTLCEHLESGGNYDESAKALHIHRSTLRYRLARIRELTGYDLRDVDTRFNLHAAARSWRFLHAESTP